MLRTRLSNPNQSHKKTCFVLFLLISITFSFAQSANTRYHYVVEKEASSFYLKTLKNDSLINKQKVNYKFKPANIKSTYISLDLFTLPSCKELIFSKTHFETEKGSKLELRLIELNADGKINKDIFIKHLGAPIEQCDIEYVKETKTDYSIILGTGLRILGFDWFTCTISKKGKVSDFFDMNINGNELYVKNVPNSNKMLLIANGTYKSSVSICTHEFKIDSTNTIPIKDLHPSFETYYYKGKLWVIDDNVSFDMKELKHNIRIINVTGNKPSLLQQVNQGGLMYSQVLFDKKSGRIALDFSEVKTLDEIPDITLRHLKPYWVQVNEEEQDLIKFQELKTQDTYITSHY